KCEESIQVAGFLLMVLSAVELSEGQHAIENNVIDSMTKEQCNDVMKERFNKKGGCKYAETFIIASLQDVNDLCQNVKGIMPGFSKKIFKVVDCTKVKDCVYNGDDSHTKTQLKLECKDNQAVRYVGAKRQI
uniref:Ribonuclease A-domain domain-containing protein n=1 Tax=Poecilia latipinna TaxID=48699 RepID=A0A3B3VBE4_9TELE